MHAPDVRWNGVPVCIVEDRHGHILRSIAMREGTDKDQSVPPVRGARERFPCLRAVGLDCGFRSPANRIELDKMLDRDPMPKKGRPAEAERARRSALPFKEMRKWRSGVESCINNLERRGMDRVLSYAADGFERMVNLSVLALNVHRIGLTALRRLRKGRKREEKRKRIGLRAA